AEIAAVERLIAGQANAAESDAAHPSPPALDALADAFQLSRFERGVVVACAGAELRPELAQACLAAGGAPHPTFRLLLATLPEAHFSATTLQGPLRHFCLVDVRGGDDLLQARLRIDERVLHHLLGVPSLDARLAALVEVVAPESELLPSQQQTAE